MMTQDIVDHHCKIIRDQIKEGDTLVVSCLNYMKNNARLTDTERHEWHWIGQQLVMNGWLTVNDMNDFEVTT